jgi:TonB dependent receptor/Carboxypeptidase regulatory-like domain/TonB-dependent Receptor Plug Domain
MRRRAALTSTFLAAIYLVLMGTFCGSEARAGTTGGISGRVVDSNTIAPVVGAVVDMSSPSESTDTVSDAKGLYTFLSLAPDTYVLRVTREGYVPYVQNGVTIQADVGLRLDVRLIAAVRTIGQVVTHARIGLVSPGQTINVYSIYPDTAAAARPLSGPGGVDQAYSALAAVPGIYVPQGQQGWYQPIYIRGGDQDQIGYELDGVPVNRSYDNAPESLLTSVGQQELQVYTGGATASSDGQGISGYINQVIKTGARIPFGSMSYGFGFPAGYQKGALEYGAACPDDRLTYYLAASLSNQDYRYLDQSNGASQYGSGFFFPSFQYNAAGNPIDLPGLTLGASSTRDREDVVNLHYAIPHPHDGGSDDLQLLHMESDLHTFTYGSFDDFGGESTFGTIFVYPDQYIYTGPVDAPLNPNLVGQYLFPNTPDASRAYQSQMSLDRRPVADNNFDLTKLQYQHNMGTHAYLRLLGYSTYSLWDIEDPIPVPSTLQYILPEITFGGVVDFADQLSDKNLLSLSGSIASSREYRYSSGFNFLLGGNFFPPNGPIGGNYIGSVPIGSLTDGTHCYDQTSGDYTSCFSQASQAMLDVNAGMVSPLTIPSGPASTNGAKWIATENALAGLINQVSPILTAGSVSDRIRPNDALTFDVGLRLEHYDDRLVDEADGYPARQFWFSAANSQLCFASSNIVVQRPIDPTTGAIGPCPTGSAPIHLSLSNDSSELNSAVEPRVAATYQVSPNTTLRASFGIYARPPNASWVQYGTVQQDLALPMAEKFLAYGFTSPQHDLVPDTSHNFDFSLEQHIGSTDMSFRLTPYYRDTMGQFENILLDTSGNESGVNVGSERSYGAEFAFQKGDFGRNGIAATLAVTYDYSRFKYSKFASGLNLLDILNQSVEQYNAYTSACGSGGSAVGKTQFGSPLCGLTTQGTVGARCFTTAGLPDPSCAPGDTPNPYWTRPLQPLFDPNALYFPYDVLPDEPVAAGNGFGSPLTATLLAQYKYNRFTATPSVTFIVGSSYGAPLSTEGGDPAQCAIDASTIPTCFDLIPIPDDYTGRFDNMGAFMQPSRLTGDLSFGYAVTPRTQLSLTMTSLFDICHQRGYAWDRPNFCVYTTMPFSVAPNSSTFIDSPNDPNYMYPYTVQNGNNNTQFLGTKIPLEAYLTLQVKL